MDRTDTTNRFRWLGSLAALILISGLMAAPASSQADDDYSPLPHQPLGGIYFVTQQYRDLLGREPDVAGLSYWVSLLDEDLNPASMVAEFVESSEFAGTREPVARIYLAAFGRLPDNAGWAYWSGLRSSGVSFGAIAGEFIASAEGERRFGGDDDLFIDSLYQNVLSRVPDESGRLFWLAQLEGGVPRSEVLLAFSESPEFVKLAAPKIRASLLYAGLLGRDPDQEGLEYWSDQISSGADYAAIVIGFLESPEYERRLSGLWCNMYPPVEVDFRDGPEIDEPTEDRPLDPRHDQMFANHDAIINRFDQPQYDEVLGYLVDYWPDYQYVVSLHESVASTACLTFMAAAPFPEQISFRPVPFRLSELDATIAKILADYGDGAPMRWDYSQGLGIEISFVSTFLPNADALLAEHGDIITELRIGSFPYPMPEPPPQFWCSSELPGTVDPVDVGLEVSVYIETTVPAGGSPRGNFTVTNNGTETYTLRWGAEVLAYVGLGGPDAVSNFNGALTLPLTEAVLTPGDSVTGDLLVGTDSCDPARGHRLTAGTYELFGSIATALGERDGDFIGDDTFYIRLPATEFTLTH